MNEQRWARRADDQLRSDLSRRRVMKGMLATAAATAAASGVSGWVTQGPARAAGAVLGPGARPNPSLPEGVDTMPQIEHIVIYMQENHSYDQYFGMYPRGDGFTLDGGGVPLNWNPDLSDNPFPVFHATPTCNNIGGDHGWNAEHTSWNGGAMDGFIKASQSTNIMGYYDRGELPFYWGLADHFPLCDRWFCSVMGPTHPNRRFLIAGTANGIVQTSVPEVLATPNAPNGTIFDRLSAHGISWNDYAIDVGDIWLYPGPDVGTFATRMADHLKTFDDFLHDCLYGTLPAVSIISPGTSGQYDEGARDVQNGEAYSHSIITSVMSSPVWDKTAIFFTYDENGGGYDHVAPPTAPAPDAIPPRITVPPDYPGDYTQLGPRVPAFVISPWSKANYISHEVHDHTSILKFIETKYNLGAITYRDANADNLMDCFDFSRPAFLDPPALPASGLPLTGSVCDPQPYPADNVGKTTTTTTGPAGPDDSGVGAANAVAPAGAVTATPVLSG